MRVLGLGGLDHNGSLAVLEDGRVVSFLEAERVLRQKNAGLATAGALQRTFAALRPGSIDAVGIADRTFWQSTSSSLRPILETLVGTAPISVWHHHDCHGFAALVASPFQRATCVTIDGKGDGLSASVVLTTRAGQRDRLTQVPSATSLGRLWWGVSEYCGLPGHHSAGKVMALAAYGEPIALWDEHLELLPDGGFWLNPRTLHPATFRQVPRIVEWLAAMTGTPAGTLQPDVAASVQQLTERIVSHIVSSAVKRSGVRDVCLAGGVALNGLANQRLLHEGRVARLFVPSVTDDRGLALGAAALASLDRGAPLPENPSGSSAFLGPALEDVTPPHPWVQRTSGPTAQEPARLLAEGALVAVCRGRDEAGPRALGHRSLLASPVSPTVRDRLNKEVKRRESFRPFGCAVPLEEASTWFDIEGCSPYMLRIAKARPELSKQIPGVLHADGTSRIQTVTRDDGSGLWEILDALRRRGHPPVLLNTSLNQRGEPLAHTVEDAALAARAMGVPHLLTDSGLYEIST